MLMGLCRQKEDRSRLDCGGRNDVSLDRIVEEEGSVRISFCTVAGQCYHKKIVRAVGIDSAHGRN